MKYWAKQKYLFGYWKPGSQNMEDYFMKHHLPHHHREISAMYFIHKLPYLKLFIKLCTNGPMICPRQYIWLKSRQTVQLCKGVLISYVCTYTQTPQQKRRPYAMGSTWKSVFNKDSHMHSRSTNELNTGSTRGRLSYLW